MTNKKRATIIYTSESHIDRFAPLLKPYISQFDFVQIVREEMLRQAEKDDGISDDLYLKVETLINEQFKDGAAAVLMTCSTLGSIVDLMKAANNQASIYRLDQALAEEAFNLGNQIAVFCATKTTIEATKNLFENENCKHDQPKNFEIFLVPNAWDLFLAGEIDNYNQAIAEYVKVVTSADNSKFDTIALAQASMDGAIPILENFDLQVICSPKSGIEKLVKVLGIST